MPEDISRVIKIFSKFLDTNLVESQKSSKKSSLKNLKTIDDLLKLPIYSFKFLNKNEAKIIEDLLDVYDIGEVAKLNRDDPFSKLIDLDTTEDPIIATKTQEELKKKINILNDKFPNLLKNLKKVITISTLITQIKEEKFDLKKEEQKIVVIGLDNAGKTAILSKFGDRLGITDLIYLKPTKGIERQKIKSENVDLYIWDMGGQKEYRERYLGNPEQFFLQTDLILYVIDVQDFERFENSIKYFKEILNILITLEENPFILIFLHKFDPDIKNDPEIQLRVEMLKDLLNETFRSLDYEFEFEIYLTSIFSLISREPKFSRYLKEIMKANVSLTDPTVRKVEGLGKILEETMNAVIRLSESISLQINDIDNRLRAIENGSIQLPQGITPIANPAQEKQFSGSGNARSRVLDELKELFAKKRRLDL
ncbi:MAG: ADP-ribosylation factor-like protein [Promethearchaeota archaeon]